VIEIQAQVIRSSQREFSCKTLDGDIVEATALGNLFKNNETIVVGDFVNLEQQQDKKEWTIISLVPRESEIFRILVREQKKKVTAANCDLLVILSSVSKPAFKQGIIDRFLVRASQWGIRPILIFNKMDEYNPDEMDIAFESSRLEPLGVSSFEICALDGDAYKPQYLKYGWDELQETLKGRTAIFLGQSGVGKSKTISLLSGGEVSLKTKKVGKVGKGSHTTTWSELIELPHFKLIDSPGIRSFSLDDIDPDDLLSFFPDLEEVATGCKFNDCAHGPSTKGCAFHHNQWSEAEKELIFSRLQSYTRIVDEVSQTPFWQKKL
jgi:ribosome biogenesis GTPase